MKKILVEKSKKKYFVLVSMTSTPVKIKPSILMPSIGADPRTWSPAEPLIGADPRTWSPAK